VSAASETSDDQQRDDSHTIFTKWTLLLAVGLGVIANPEALLLLPVSLLSLDAYRFVLALAGVGGAFLGGLIPAAFLRILYLVVHTGGAGLASRLRSGGSGPEADEHET